MCAYMWFNLTVVAVLAVLEVASAVPGVAVLVVANAAAMATIPLLLLLFCLLLFHRACTRTCSINGTPSCDAANDVCRLHPAISPADIVCFFLLLKRLAITADAFLLPLLLLRYVPLLVRSPSASQDPRCCWSHQCRHSRLCRKSSCLPCHPTQQCQDETLCPRRCREH